MDHYLPNSTVLGKIVGSHATNEKGVNSFEDLIFNGLSYTTCAGNEIQK